MNRWLAALGIVIGLGVVAGVAGAVVLIGDSGSGMSSEPDVAGSGMSSVAGDLERHADQLTEHASVMIEAGQESGRDAWIEKGTELLGEARRLQALADQITRTRRDLILFPPDGAVDIYRLRADGRVLVTAGEELTERGQSMRSEAETMIREADDAGRPDLANAAEGLKEAAETMIGDGRLVSSAGQPLVDEANNLDRSLGH